MTAGATRRGWRRLLGWFRGGGGAPPELEAGEGKEPVVLRSQQESWLSRLSEAVAEGERLDAIGDEDFWEQVEAMWRDGHERLASEWVAKFIDAPLTPAPAAVELRLRLVEMFDRRGDLGPAVSHLEALADIDEHATRAHYLLGEHYRRRGEERLALRHYEAVLARDVDYPNVRVRVERLRAASGHGAAAPGGETIVGPEAGASAGARYLLVRELGRGATAVVYLARDAQLERDVAVKLLHPHLAAAQQAAACSRFFAEARIAASLRHPNILAILDLDEGARRIVMELAAGGTLRELLESRGPRPLRRALERHVQLLSALVAAHRRGIVHRDVKPANLMFRRNPDAPGTEIVLGDFGVAHLPDAAEAAEDRGRPLRASRSKASSAVGTLAYMAPEQRRGERADPRWDLYAAAVVLYELLAGRRPWDKERLLRGDRDASDFTPPESITAAAHPELARRLAEHMQSLGEPQMAHRPTSLEALAVARELRDLAIATEGHRARNT